ncbi:serine/threonine protein kinase, putative isoform 1, partial [Tanacetum coccineum]
MENITPLTNSPGSVRTLNDETRRVKILCSFNGSILPRPQDGRLRYVGGETRILSVPRDIGYEDLMTRMKELFENASVLKYKQPDEDLDALVSVVNDDDVVNMMEEYDKLGTGDRFTRLRIFLFTSNEVDDPLQFLDTDGRDSERRYVDALNSLSDSPDYGKMSNVDEYFSQLNLDVGGGITGQRNIEMHMTPVNLHHLTIPHLGSLQNQQIEAPRSPAYYSPRHGNDYSSSPSPSPSYSCYNGPYVEPTDRVFERGPSDDYFRQPHLNHLSPVDHRSQLPENVPWLQTSPVSGEHAGFPNNIMHGTNVCEHCPPSFPQPFYIRDPNMGSGRPSDHYILDGNGMNLATGPIGYPDNHHIPLSYAHHDDRTHYGRHRHEFGNELFRDQPVARYGNFPYGYGPENGHLSANSFWRDVLSPIHGSPSNEASISPQQENVTNNLMKSPLVDVLDCYPVRPLKLIPNSYNQEDQQVPPERVQSTTNLIGCSNPKDSVAAFDQSPTLVDHKDVPLNTPNKEAIQNTNAPHSPERKELNGEESIDNSLGVNAPQSPEKAELKVERLNHIPQVVESVKKAALESNEEVKNEAQEGVLSAIENAAEVREEPTHELDVADAPEDSELDSDTGTESNSKIEQTKAEEEAIARGLQTIRNDDLEEIRQLGAGTYGSVYHGKWKGSDVAIKRIKASCFAVKPTERERMRSRQIQIQQHRGPNRGRRRADQADKTMEVEKISHFLKWFGIDLNVMDLFLDHLGMFYLSKKGTRHPMFLKEDYVHGSLFDPNPVYVVRRKLLNLVILGRRGLHSGDYNWPEVIADFWKEALMLSSLHHPNVVSFYGIVRDGPDGSLATVTEYMVNGSLKQFLKKKDRTIDRRKRLIIAMDTAFGMEYLHGKNIVHFDLKCENLLVNMRDPHRPICKIGDLGLSKVKERTMVSGGVRGTLPWMAPELLSGKSHMVTDKIDVYSFGVVMWELLTGDEPYTNMHCASIIGGIVNNTLRPTIPTWCDPEWKSLMESCWSGDPQERPSFLEISQKLRTMAAAINVKTVFDRGNTLIRSLMENYREDKRDLFMPLFDQEKTYDSVPLKPWKKVLAPKERGGLGVSSLYALNRGLMFKWVWRFNTQDSSLWARVIKAIHGDDGKMGVITRAGSKSCWMNIVHETNALLNKVNRYSFRRAPRGGMEQEQFNEIVALVNDVILAPISDRWTWTLESSGDFSVASVRKSIDDKSIPVVDYKTRWIKYVPIKVNVHAWKGAETSSHLFFSCCMVRQVVRLITCWLDVPYIEFESYDGWLAWLMNLRLPYKNKMMLERVFYVMWWHLWMFRNKTIFEAKAPAKALFFDDVV